MIIIYLFYYYIIDYIRLNDCTMHVKLSTSCFLHQWQAIFIKKKAVSMSCIICSLMSDDNNTHVGLHIVHRCMDLHVHYARMLQELCLNMSKLR